MINLVLRVVNLLPVTSNFVYSVVAIKASFRHVVFV